MYSMLPKKIKQQVGNYVVTPYSHKDSQGNFAASVSIQRGVYDRIFRFIPQFNNAATAQRYALSQAREMVLANQL